jgi:hypothetical protein
LDVDILIVSDQNFAFLPTLPQSIVNDACDASQSRLGDLVGGIVAALLYVDFWRAWFPLCALRARFLLFNNLIVAKWLRAYLLQYVASVELKSAPFIIV